MVKKNLRVKRVNVVGLSVRLLLGVSMVKGKKNLRVKRGKIIDQTKTS